MSLEAPPLVCSHAHVLDLPSLPYACNELRLRAVQAGTWPYIQMYSPELKQLTRAHDLYLVPGLHPRRRRREHGG